LILARSKIFLRENLWLKIARRTGCETAVGLHWKRNVASKFTPWITVSGEMLQVYHRHHPKLMIIAELKEMLQARA